MWEQFATQPRARLAVSNWTRFSTPRRKWRHGSADQHRVPRWHQNDPKRVRISGGGYYQLHCLSHPRHQDEAAAEQSPCEFFADISSVLRRLRAEIPEGKLIVIWDGAPYHRAKAVWSAAANLNIPLEPLPGYSPDLMPVEALWRWLREDITYHHCHATAEDLIRHVAAFETTINQKTYEVADPLRVNTT